MNNQNTEYNLQEAIKYVQKYFQDSRSSFSLEEHPQLKTHLLKALELQERLPTREKLEEINGKLGNSGEYPIYPTIKERALPNPSTNIVERNRLNQVLWVLLTSNTLKRISEGKKSLDGIL